MPETIRAVAYCRKSNEDDGNSVDQQREWARALAEGEGVVILREFIDQAIAGWDTARRSAFHEALVYCQEQARLKNPVRAILCWNTSRFSRSDSFETGSFLHSFREAGVDRLRTRERWFDFGRKEDRALLNLEQVFTNQQYVINLAADSLRGQLSRASQGGRCGGTIPYGYRAEREEVVGKNSRRYFRTKRLILGPDHEVLTVRWIFEQYAAGEKGCRLIAAELNARGVPSPGGGMWPFTTVRKILADPVYLGRNAYGRRRVGVFFGVVKAQVTPAEKGKRTRFTPSADWVVKDGCHEPIVSEELFNRVARIMGKRTHGKRPGGGDFPLTGIMRCGHCGAAMSGRTTKARRPNRPVRVYRNYECQGYVISGPARCQYGAVRADALALAVIDKLLPDWLTDANVEKLRAEIRRQDDAAERAEPEGAERLRGRLTQLEKELDRATDELLRTDDEKQILRIRERIRKRGDERDRLEGELRGLEGLRAPRDADAQVDAAMAKLGNLRKARTTGDRAAQRAVLHEAVTKIEVYFERRQAGKRNRSKFAKALVWVAPDLHIVYRTGQHHHS
jgi:site-specific DNA recombinase